MLEIHTLKQHLNTARQELTQALYQHEAACRVVARLIKERDQAREEFAKLKDVINAGTAQKTAAEAVMKGINGELADKFNELSDALSEARKVRKPPTDLATEAQMIAYHEVYQAAVHPKVTCLELTHKNPNLVLTGGKNHVACLHNIEKKATVATFQHEGKITAVSFVPTDMLTPITCSADGKAKVWEVDMEDNYSQKLVYTASNHTKAITSCSIHPYSDYCLFCSKDATWSFHNLAKCEIVQSVSVQNGIPIHSGQIHPDGLMVATGLADGHIFIWDIRSQEVVHKLEGHKGAVKRISYSEKGYQRLSCGKNDSKVMLWDLRKLATQGPAVIEDEKNPKPESVSFDLYGMFFGVAGDVVEIYKARGAAKVAEVAVAGGFTDMRFGEKNQTLVCGTADGFLKVFGQ